MRSEPSLQQLSRVDAARLAATGQAMARTVSGRLSNWRRTRVGLRGLVVSVLALPLLVAAIIGLAGGNLVVAGGSAGAWVLVFLGARLNRRGLFERHVAPERRFTRAIRFPYQHAAALSVANGVGLGAYAGAGHALWSSVVFALLATAGMALAYGISARTLSRVQDSPGVQDASVRKALEEAEGRLLAIERSAMDIGNLELQQRLLSIAKEGHAILALLAERPAAMHRLRRFLNVHLEGSERVASGYARTHRLVRGGVLEGKFRSVLLQIESAFRRQSQALREDGLTDLDIQIEVLRKQLQRGGLS